MAYVYQHRRNDTNEIFYIGIGTRKDRAKSKRTRNKWWSAIERKHGITAEILFDDVDIKQAKQIEKYLIAYYGRADLGLGKLVNMTDGADGVYNLSKEQKDKMRTRLGKTPWNKGVPMSKESKDKLSKSLKGRVSPRKGVVVSEESRRKMSEAAKRRVSSFKGKHHTDESIKKLKEINQVYTYYQYDETGKLFNTYNSLSDASESTKINRSNIYRASKGERLSAGGYVWKREKIKITE